MDFKELFSSMGQPAAETTLMANLENDEKGNPPFTVIFHDSRTGEKTEIKRFALFVLPDNETRAKLQENNIMAGSIITSMGTSDLLNIDRMYTVFIREYLKTLPPEVAAAITKKRFERAMNDLEKNRRNT